MEDKMAKAIIRNKSTVPIHGLQPGQEKSIEVTKEGIPKDRLWRRRLEDAKIDNCVELQSKKQIVKKPKQEDKD